MNVEKPIAVNRKTPTATTDRILNLEIPQRPCPLVHPLLSFVPNPTSNPAKAKPGNVVHAAT